GPVLEVVPAKATPGGTGGEPGRRPGRRGRRGHLELEASRPPGEPSGRREPGVAHGQRPRALVARAGAAPLRPGAGGGRALLHRRRSGRPAPAAPDGVAPQAITGYGLVVLRTAPGDDRGGSRGPRNAGRTRHGLPAVGTDRRRDRLPARGPGGIRAGPGDP